MTYLPKREAAIVSNRKRDSLDIYLPDCEEYAEVPRCVRFMAACAMRFHHDEAFVEEQLKWMDEAIIKSHGGLQ